MPPYGGIRLKKMKYGQKITFTSDCQGTVGPSGCPGSSTHLRGSDLLKASSTMAQQCDLALGFGKPSYMVRNGCKKLLLWVSAQCFRATFKLRPWPGLLCRYAHSTPYSLHPSQPCSTPPGMVGPLGEVPDCSPLPQHRCTLTFSDMPSAQLQWPLLPSETEVSNSLHAAV